MLNIVMFAFRKIYNYAVQLINKMKNYRIQIFIQKTVSMQTVELLRQSDEWIFENFMID